MKVLQIQVSEIIIEDKAQKVDQWDNNSENNTFGTTSASLSGQLTIHMCAYMIKYATSIIICVK